jgi:predicted AAA+ superfamily ATPase
MERSKLEEFNQWWLSGRVDPDLALPFKRDNYAEISKAIANRFVIALVGLRRTGKSTTMYQIIDALLKQNVDGANLLFFSFDEETAGLGEVIDLYRDIHGKDFRSERVYVFLDEVQKCAGWENELKKYYDLYPKIKFIVSGSESLFIRKKTKETLAGRLFEFTFATFSFGEYLRFNSIGEKEGRYETKIRPLFINFLEKGGFPESFSMTSDKEFKEYIRALVVDKILYKDIPKTFGIDDPDLLRALLETIATNPGIYIDYLSLSRQFGKDRRVIKSYISYLEQSFLIRILNNYRKNNVSSLRKRKRAYPVDSALIRLYKPTFDRSFFGRIVESVAINASSASYFWRNGIEVDMIRDGVPIEVKYQEQINRGDFKAISEFASKFGAKEGIIVTKSDDRVAKAGNVRIKMIPAWKWLLQQKAVNQ